ncbi:MAG TPA: cupin domain-containing protein [Dehalococcoidia bacterium]|nr:cupin domain-containing protein [Dehalococcoidia bacterium]
MQYVRKVDFGAFNPNEFHSQFIADRSTGLESCMCIVTRVPPGKGSSLGRHVHPTDQIYYLLRGQMQVQIGDQRLTAGPKHLVYIPASVPHWNWNDSDEGEVHFEVIVPQPQGEPAATSVDESVVKNAPAGVELVRRLDESQFSGGDSWSQEVIAERASGIDSLSMGVFKVPPGARLPGLHVHRFGQVYYVLEGTMTVQIGLERYEASPDTLVILPAGMPHTNWNAGLVDEYHLNLRVPQPLDTDARQWDLPVTIGEAH